MPLGQRCIFLGKNTWFCLSLDDTTVKSTCYTHYAFYVKPEDFGNTRDRLIDYKFKDNCSPGESFYFKDPDGHKLEIHTGD